MPSDLPKKSWKKEKASFEIMLRYIMFEVSWRVYLPLKWCTIKGMGRILAEVPFLTFYYWLRMTEDTRATTFFQCDHMTIESLRLEPTSFLAFLFLSTQYILGRIEKLNWFSNTYNMLC